MKNLTFTLILSFISIVAISQTTHTINLPSSGTATINVNCSVGDVLKFQSSSTPFAIRVFRNPAPNFTVTPTGNSTSYTVTATDTSYSSIVSIAPVTTCVGKIILSTPTSLVDNNLPDLRLSVFPNPTKSFMHFTGFNSALPVYVSDVTGKVIFESKIDPIHNMIDLSPFKSGIYFIQVDINRFKIIKED